MLAPKQPWEKIAWSPEHEQKIYRDWGLFYMHKQQLNIAQYYCDKSLQIKGDDDKALYYRSICKRNIAQTEQALRDCRTAGVINDPSAPIKIEICNALYEMNQFEKCKVEAYDYSRRYKGKNVTSFMNRLHVIDQNFKDCLGDTLGPFLLKNERNFHAVVRQIEKENFIDTRPLWKTLRDEGKCDVLSILEIEEVLLPPREVARRARAFKVFNQIYLNKSWQDVLFLKDLRDDPNLLMPQFQESTPFLRALVNSTYDVAKKYLKMLHARSPLYNENMRRCPNKKVWDKHHEAHLFRVQYETRRRMLTAQKEIVQLRNEGKIKKLARYIEELMGDYVVLKTHRVMPWKFEFINEVYNILALAYSDRFRIPERLTGPLRDHIFYLLELPVNKGKDQMQFVFGDKSTYQEPDAIDHSLIAYRNFLSRLEKRMRFARFSIEKCYLLHEIAHAHLRQRRFDMCCSVARKAVIEAKQGKSHLWSFLSTMLICKSHAILHKTELVKEALDEALAITEFLHSPYLQSFVELCLAVNEEELSIKKRNQSIDMNGRKKSKASINSQSSQYSNSYEGEFGEGELSSAFSQVSYQSTTSQLTSNYPQPEDLQNAEKIQRILQTPPPPSRFPIQLPQLLQRPQAKANQGKSSQPTSQQSQPTSQPTSQISQATTQPSTQASTQPSTQPSTQQSQPSARLSQQSQQQQSAQPPQSPQVLPPTQQQQIPQQPQPTTQQPQGAQPTQQPQGTDPKQQEQKAQPEQPTKKTKAPKAPKAPKAKKGKKGKK